MREIGDMTAISLIFFEEMVILWLLIGTGSCR